MGSGGSLRILGGSPTPCDGVGEGGGAVGAGGSLGILRGSPTRCDGVGEGRGSVGAGEVSGGLGGGSWSPPPHVMVRAGVGGPRVLAFVRPAHVPEAALQRDPRRFCSPELARLLAPIFDPPPVPPRRRPRSPSPVSLALGLWGGGGSQPGYGGLGGGPGEKMGGLRGTWGIIPKLGGGAWRGFTLGGLIVSAKLWGALSGRPLEVPARLWESRRVPRENGGVLVVLTKLWRAGAGRVIADWWCPWGVLAMLGGILIEYGGGRLGWVGTWGGQFSPGWVLGVQGCTLCSSSPLGMSCCSRCRSFLRGARGLARPCRYRGGGWVGPCFPWVGPPPVPPPLDLAMWGGECDPVPPVPSRPGHVGGVCVCVRPCPPCPPRRPPWTWPCWPPTSPWTATSSWAGPRRQGGGARAHPAPPPRPRPRPRAPAPAAFPGAAPPPPAPALPSHGGAATPPSAPP